MSLEDRLDRLISLLEAILLRFAPSPVDPRNSGPFAPYGPTYPPPGGPCGLYPSPVLPNPIQPTPPGEVPMHDRGAFLSGLHTDVLPFNGLPGEGSHVEVWGEARLLIHATETRRKSIDVSQVPPGGFDSVEFRIDGIPIPIPFAGGLQPIDILFIQGRDYICDVKVSPDGFGCSLLLR